MRELIPISSGLPPHQIRFALRLLGQAGVPLEELLRGTGIDPADLDDADFIFRESALWPLCTNLAARFGADWYLRIPLLWGAELQSTIGLAVRSSRNLGEGLQTIVELVGLRWPMLDVRQRVSNGGHVLEICRTDSIPAEHWPMVMIFSALNLQSAASSFLGDDVSGLHYRFDIAPPPYAVSVAALLSGGIVWNARVASVEVPDTLLDRVSPLASTTAHATMVETLRRSAERASREETTAGRVAAVLDAVAHGQKKAESVAATLGMTRRTLERKLAEENVLFGTLAEASLKQRLENLLAGSHRSPDELAEILGYHDGSSLMRACRRWYGMPLSALRRQITA